MTIRANARSERTIPSRSFIARCGRAFFWSFLVMSAFGVYEMPSAAQAIESSLSGRILDPSEAAVIGAQIVAIPEGKTTGVQATSDQTGEFSMTWDRGRHHFEIDVNEAGAYDWFYMDRDSDFRAGEEAIPVGSLSSHLIPYLLRTVQ